MQETSSIQVILGSWAKTVYGGNAKMQPEEIVQAINPHLGRMLEQGKPILVASPVGDEIYSNLLKPKDQIIHQFSLEAKPYLDYQEEGRKFVLKPRFALGVKRTYLSGGYLSSSNPVIHNIEARYAAELLLAAFPQTQQLQKVINFFLKVVARLQLNILIADILKKAQEEQEEKDKETKCLRKNPGDLDYSAIEQQVAKITKMKPAEILSQHDIQLLIDARAALKKKIPILFDPEISRFFPEQVALRLRLSA